VKARARLALLVALPAFAVDQASKLTAAAIHPHAYVQNTSWRSPLWALAVIAVAVGVLRVPFLPLAPALGLWIGGATGNLLDVHVWPGGVPDFIRFDPVRGTFNLADVFVAVGAAGLGVLLMLWVGLGTSAHARAQVAQRRERRARVVDGEGGADLAPAEVRGDEAA
jgi:lipoprotein signal peptidase